jgi:WD40 repeat protein
MSKPLPASLPVKPVRALEGHTASVTVAKFNRMKNYFIIQYPKFLFPWEEQARSDFFDLYNLHQIDFSKKEKGSIVFLVVMIEHFVFGIHSMENWLKLIEGMATKWQILICTVTGTVSFKWIFTSMSESIQYTIRSYDNSQIASCGGDRQPFLWDVTTGRVIRKFKGHDHVSFFYLTQFSILNLFIDSSVHSNWIR